MRTAAAVSIVACLVALVFAHTAPTPPVVTGVMGALTLPAEALLDEQIVVRAVAALPDGQQMARRFRVCEASGACRTTGWGTVAGSTWAGYAGEVRALTPGTLTVQWTLYGDWGGDNGRAALRLSQTMVVRAAE
jgi:hypothetical protein